MAFVFETSAQEEEVVQLRSTIIDTRDHPLPSRALNDGEWWVIDRERDLLLVPLGSFGRENPLVSFYSFVFKGYLIKVMCTIYYDCVTGYNHFFDFHQFLLRGELAPSPNYRDYDNYIPEALKDRTEEVHAALAEAFNAYVVLVRKGKLGICHFDDSSVEPDWYPESVTD